jgi:uncharacterized protein YfkK (UPF0435 family)
MIKIFTEKEAIEAANARRKGEWDNPHLIKYGELSVDCEQDIRDIYALVKKESAHYGSILK